MSSYSQCFCTSWFDSVKKPKQHKTPRYMQYFECPPSTGKAYLIYPLFALTIVVYFSACRNYLIPLHYWQLSTTSTSIPLHYWNLPTSSTSVHQDLLISFHYLPVTTDIYIGSLEFTDIPPVRSVVYISKLLFSNMNSFNSSVIEFNTHLK